MLTGNKGRWRGRRTAASRRRPGGPDLRVSDAATGTPLYEGRSAPPAAGLAVLPDNRHAITGGLVDSPVVPAGRPPALASGRPELPKQLRQVRGPVVGV